MDAWLKSLISKNVVAYGVPQSHVVSALERAGLETPEALVSTTSELWGDATKLPPALLEKLQEHKVCPKSKKKRMRHKSRE